MHHKRLLIIFGVLIVALMCVLSFLIGGMLSKAQIRGEVVRLPDGTQVMCIISDSGGVSCDWLGVGV